MTRRRESFAEARDRRAAEQDPAVVLDAALRFLEPRARSVAEVRRRLAGAGFRAELVDGAIGRLRELDMLDDKAFARHWVESRDRAHPRGTVALRRELRMKGVADDVIRLVLEARAAEQAAADGVIGIPDTADVSADERAARQLLSRKASTLGRVADPRQRRQRAYALLVRSGFEPGLAGELAREVGEASEPGEDGATP